MSGDRERERTHNGIIVETKLSFQVLKVGGVSTVSGVRRGSMIHGWKLGVQHHREDLWGKRAVLTAFYSQQKTLLAPCVRPKT